MVISKVLYFCFKHHEVKTLLKFLLTIAFYNISLNANAQSVTGKLKNPVAVRLGDGFLVYGFSKVDGEKRLNVYKFNSKLEKTAEYIKEVPKPTNVAFYYSTHEYHFFYIYTSIIILDKNLGVVDDNHEVSLGDRMKFQSRAGDQYLRLVTRSEKMYFYKDKLFVLKEKAGHQNSTAVNEIDVCESNIDNAFNKYNIKFSIKIPCESAFDSDIFMVDENRVYVLINDMLKGKGLSQAAQYIMCFDVNNGKLVYSYKMNDIDNKNTCSLSNVVVAKNGDLILAGNYFDPISSKKNDDEELKQGDAYSSGGYFLRRISKDGKLVNEKKYKRGENEDYYSFYIQRIIPSDNNQYWVIGEAVGRYALKSFDIKCKSYLKNNGLLPATNHINFVAPSFTQSKFFFAFSFDDDLNILFTKKIDIPKEDDCSNIIIGGNTKTYNHISVNCFNQALSTISDTSSVNKYNKFSPNMPLQTGNTVSNAGFSYENMESSVDGKSFSLLFNNSMMDGNSYKGVDKLYYLYKDDKLITLRGADSKETGEIFLLESGKVCKFTFSGNEDTFKLEILDY